MPEDQREGCEIKFNEVYRRLDAVEKYNTEKQDEKINTIDKMMLKFEMLFAQQNETNKTMLERFEEDRKENIKVGKERDAIIKELSQNVMKTTEELVNISDQQRRLSEKIELVSEEVKTSNEKGKLDLPALAKNIITLAITGGSVGFIYFIVRFFIEHT